MNVRNIFVSMILVIASGTGVLASELRIGSADVELEKIQFNVAMEAARSSVSAMDQTVVLQSNAPSVAPYENGDAYYLNGNLTDEWTKQEWDLYYEIAKWLVRTNFRVIMNPVAKEEHLREAVQNPNVSVIIWSSHGSKEGELFDSSGSALPSDVFFKNASSSLHQVILSNCWGEASVQRYLFPKTVKVKHWVGESTTLDLFKYLFSDEWNHDLETN